jgi:hypothetical protein
MRTSFATFSFAATIAAGAFATSPAFATTAAGILAANKTASGGTAWDGKATLKTAYDYSGSGMTGKVESVADLHDGRFVDSAFLGPMTLIQGFDGSSGWAKDPSGTVTPQNGAGRVFAVNEAYRDANLWWRPDFGGAQVTLDAQKTIDGTTYDVVTFVPKDGAAFDALFDTKTHLLGRIDEKQGPLTLITTLSDYRKVDGAMIPGKQYQVASDGKNAQTENFISASFVSAEPDGFYSMPKVVLSDASIAGGAKATTFPFRLVNNHIYADVRVNGKGPYTFIFDTGGVNIVSPSLAAELGLTVEGKMDARGSGSGTMQAGFTQVKRLELGNASIVDQKFMSVPLDSMAHVEGMKMPGMIGFETFRRFVTRIDYGAKTITLIDPKSFDPRDAGTAVPIVFDGNDLEADGSYNGIPGRFVIDTGARNSLLLDTPFVEKNKLHDAAVKSGEATAGWGVGGPTKAYVMHGGELKIGSVAIEHPLVLLSTSTAGSDAAAELAGNVGGGVLKRFVVTLDYEHSTMYLKPVGGEIADLDTFDRAGVWINEDTEGFKVVDVTTGAPAADAGLAVGDVVTQVDGKPASAIALPELRKMLRTERPGTVITFAVKGKGEVKVKLRDLI